MKKNIAKLLLDGLMLAAVTLFYSKHTFGMQFHEIGGLALCGVFLVHLTVNARWVRGVTARLFQKTLPWKTKLGYAVNTLLLLCFALIALSGILISKTIFTGISGDASVWKPLHYFAAALTIVLLGVHIGLHADFLRGMGRKLLRLPRPLSSVLLTAALVLVVSFGGYQMVTGSFARWLSAPFTQSTHTGQQQGQKPEGAGEQNRNRGKGGARQEGGSAGGVAQALTQGAVYGSMILGTAFVTAGGEHLLRLAGQARKKEARGSSV